MLASVLLALAQASMPQQGAAPKQELNFRLDLSSTVIVQYDLDKDGGLSEAEFKALVAARVEAMIAASPEAWNSRTAEQRSKALGSLTNLFSEWDADKDGKITQADIARLARNRFPVRLEPKERLKPVPYQSVSGWIVFRATVAGREVWGLLDNGAGRSFIDAEVAQAAGIKPDASVTPMRTPTGVLEARLASSAAISIPGNFQVDGPVLVADLSGVSKGAGRPIGLVIGREYFANLAVIVDRQRSTFLFVPSGAVSVTSSDAPLALTGDGQQIETVINGKRLLLALDLGSTSQIALSQSAWDAVVPKGAKIAPNKRFGADGRSVDSQDALIPSLTIGGRTVRNVTVSLTPTSSSEGDGPPGHRLADDFVLRR